MRVLTFIFICIFSQSILAASNDLALAVDKKVETYIKSLTSVNNLEVWLKQNRQQMTASGYSELLKIIKEDPSPPKYYHAQKISNRSFALKLKNSKMAVFEMDVQRGVLLIGKTAFKWNAKTSIQGNIDVISGIMKSEFVEKKQSAFSLFIPTAHAEDETGLQTVNDLAIAAASASVTSMWSADLFIGRARAFCAENNPLRPKTLGEHDDVRRDFEESKVYYSPRLINLWTVPAGVYAKFHAAQVCLEKSDYITRADFLEAAVESVEESTGVTQ